MEDKQWKLVSGFEDKYEVSSCGSVRTIGSGRGRVHGRELIQATMPRGYKVVNLWKDNKGRTRLVHRLVAEAFIGEIPDGMQVNHINGKKEDNHSSNLEIVTNEENRTHAIQTGLIDNKGSKNPMSKINDDTVLAIREKHSQGIGYKRLAKMFNLSWGCVRAVATGKTWSHL